MGLHGQDRELVAAEAGDGVLGADGGAQRVGAGDQAAVAGGVPVGVVDRLEAVEVDDHDDGVEIMAPAAALLRAQEPGPPAPIETTGQRVESRLALDAHELRAKARDLLG